MLNLVYSVFIISTFLFNLIPTVFIHESYIICRHSLSVLLTLFLLILLLLITSFRVRIALALKKIPYEYVPINILAVSTFNHSNYLQ